MVNTSVSPLSHKGNGRTKQWFSSREAAALLQCSTVAVTSYCRKKLLIARQVPGRKQRFVWQINAKCIRELLKRSATDSNWLSVYEAADLLARSHSYIFALCSKGDLECRRVPGRLPGSPLHLEVKAAGVRAKVAAGAQLALTTRDAADAAGVTREIIVRLFHAGILEGKRRSDGKLAIEATSFALYQSERAKPDYWAGERLLRYRSAHPKSAGRGA